MKAHVRSGSLLCVLAFVLLAGYAIARPSSESLFLERHGARMLPYAWLAVAGTSMAAVAAYNRAAAIMPLGRVMQWGIAISAASLVALVALARIPGAAFLLYVWKDVHIVVLLEVLWSFANLVMSTQQARWFNGVFCAVGSLGGLAGNLLVGDLASRFGTARAPLFVLPLFAIQVVLVARLARAAGEPAPKRRVAIGLSDARDLIAKSPYVGWLVLLIGIVQLVINLVDYAYQDAIAAAYPAVDARTAVIGQIYGAIDVASIVLQLGSGLVIGALGVRSTLLLVPGLLGAATLGFAASPRFALMAMTKIASKAFDYSLFRTAKEMLYIPLSYADKTRGKALVDMLTYRVAKGIASFVILGLTAVAAGSSVVTAVLVAIAGWIAVTLAVTSRYRRQLASR